MSGEELIIRLPPQLGTDTVAFWRYAKSIKVNTTLTAWLGSEMLLYPDHETSHNLEGIKTLLK